jgi:hypothetical protein
MDRSTSVRQRLERLAVTCDCMSAPRRQTRCTASGGDLSKQACIARCSTVPVAAPGMRRSASCAYRISLGPRAAQKVRSFRAVASREKKASATGPVCRVEADAYRVACILGRERRATRVVRRIVRPGEAREQWSRHRQAPA